MSTVIPVDYQDFIDRKVASGQFRSADEVVLEALRQFSDRERKLDALRSEIMIGIDQLERGEGIPLDEAFDEFLRDVDEAQ